MGSALGDAIGELAFEYKTEERLRSNLEGIDELRYTDDTAMAIGIAESLVEKREVDQEHLGETFKKNYREEPWRGYGQGPPKIFDMVESGMGYVEAAETLFGGEGSKGNGAAMRIAPVGVSFCGEEDQYEKAVKTAEVTHTHRLGKDGAGVLAVAVGRAAEAEDISTVEFASELTGKARTEEFTDSLRNASDLLRNDASRKEAAEELGTSVLIERSVPYAIFSFLKDHGSYEESLMNAIMVSGDRDTIGAMTGALAGAYLGADAIPKTWRDRLEDVGYIRELADELYELHQIPV